MSNPTAVRQMVVKIHRYIGLTLALFLIVIAVTGSVIPFYHELERVFNSKLRVVEPRKPGWTLPDLLAIRQRLEAQDPRAHVFSLQFPQRPDESVFSRVQGAIDPATGEPYDLDYTEVFANPYTGERLGDRLFGHFSFQPKDIIAQIYFLHYALVLPELAGAMFVGILSFIWTIDCFVGFYLTLPVGAKRKGQNGKQKSYVSRWKPAWQIKRGAATNRVIYDMHRATGLWFWPILLLFAWTGFALDLPGYYAPIMNAVTGYEHFQESSPRPPLAQPLIRPPVDWYKALQLGQRYLAEQAQAQGFEVKSAAALEYRRDLGMYFYLAHTSRDLRDGETPTESDSPATATTVAIDARDGRFIGMQIPTGQRAGNTFSSWIIALHLTSVWGLPWKIAVSLIGLLVCVTTVTGLLIWWRKRKSRSPRQHPRGARSASSASPGKTLAADPQT